MVLEKVASAGTVLKVVVPVILSGCAFWPFYKGEGHWADPGRTGGPSCPPAAPPPAAAAAACRCHSFARCLRASTHPPPAWRLAGIWGNGRTMNEEWYTAGVSDMAGGFGNSKGKQSHAPTHARSSSLSVTLPCATASSPCAGADDGCHAAPGLRPAHSGKHRCACQWLLLPLESMHTCTPHMHSFLLFTPFFLQINPFSSTERRMHYTPLLV